MQRQPVITENVTKFSDLDLKNLNKKFKENW